MIIIYFRNCYFDMKILIQYKLLLFTFRQKTTSPYINTLKIYNTQLDE